MVHLGVVRLGIDPQVPHGQRLEEEPEGAEIGTQLIRAGTKRGNCQRRIDEVPLGRPTQSGPGTKMRRPGRLILDREDALERVQIALNGLRVQGTRITPRIGRDDRDRRLGGHVPGQRLQHPPDQHRVAADTIHAPDVGTTDLLQVVPDESLGIARCGADHAGPAAPADELDEIHDRRSAVLRRQRLSTQHGLQGHLSGRVP